MILFYFAALFFSYMASLKKQSHKQAKIYGIMAISVLLLAQLVLMLLVTIIFEIFLIIAISTWIVSLIRLIESKHSLAYVKQTSFRDSKFFVMILTGATIFYWLGTAFTWFGVTLPQATLGVSLAILVSTMFSLYKYRMTRTESVSDIQPTVTLAIPARNETKALKQCLEAAMTSNYPKLEVLVLDDCSQDATAEVIKTFAHDGVRFVQGAEPAQAWIGKNNAYKTLLDQASGEYVLFIGVDVHLSVDSITQMINYVKSNSLEMISVLPERISRDYRSHVLQPLRYFWQFSVPRFFTSYPPAISSCWLANRDALIKMGGFDAVQNSLTPEAHIAKKFSEIKKYRYLLGDTDLEITTKKSPKSQINTALRVTYPVLRRSFAISLIMAIAITALLISPFLGAILSIFGVIDETLFIYAAVVLTVSHVIVLAKIAPAALVTSLITLPLALTSQVILIFVSAWKYEFGEITWKGRSVCIPQSRLR
jgi:hypothetical protein